MRQQGKTKKLTDEQVAELRRLGATKKYSYDQLGKRFGINLGYVGRLLKRGNKR